MVVVVEVEVTAAGWTGVQHCTGPPQLTPITRYKNIEPQSGSVGCKYEVKIINTGVFIVNICECQSICRGWYHVIVCVFQQVIVEL